MGSEFYKEITRLTPDQLLNEANSNRPHDELQANLAYLYSMLSLGSESLEKFLQSLFGNLLDMNENGTYVLTNAGDFGADEDIDIWTGYNSSNQIDDTVFGRYDSTAISIQSNCHIKRTIFLPKILRGQQIILSINALGGTITPVINNTTQTSKIASASYQTLNWLYTTVITDGVIELEIHNDNPSSDVVIDKVFLGILQQNSLSNYIDIDNIYDWTNNKPYINATTLNSFHSKVKNSSATDLAKLQENDYYYIPVADGNARNSARESISTTFNPGLDADTLDGYHLNEILYGSTSASSGAMAQGRYEVIISAADGTDILINHNLNERNVFVYYIDLTTPTTQGMVNYNYSTATPNSCRIFLRRPMDAIIVVVGGGAVGNVELTDAFVKFDEYGGLLTRASVSQITISKGRRIADNSFTGLDWTTTLTADLTVSGAGGLDSGAEEANAWYAVWVIYNPTLDTYNSLLSVIPTRTATNSPSSGNNIVITFTNTKGYYVGQKVLVYGTVMETAYVTTVVPGVSITVDTLANSHTTPIVMALDYYGETVTLPTDYTYKRYIGRVRNSSGDLLMFRQVTRGESTYTANTNTHPTYGGWVYFYDTIPNNTEANLFLHCTSSVGVHYESTDTQAVAASTGADSSARVMIGDKPQLYVSGVGAKGVYTRGFYDLYTEYYKIRC